MIFSKDSYKDIVRYYEGTIIKLKETEDRLWRIRHITPHEVELQDVDGFSLWLDLNHPYEVDYPMPGRAMYQCGEYAMLLSRKPAKQYFRGICSSNTSLQLLKSNGSWAPTDVSISRLQQFVDKPCYQSLATLSPEYSSWALSPVFSVSKSGSLFALNKSVGVIYFEQKIINCAKLLFPEIQPLLPEDWKVVQ